MLYSFIEHFLGYNYMGPHNSGTCLIILRVGVVMSEYGILSIIPPLLAIFLAFKTRDVILSLFTSLIVGAVIAARGNLYIALVNFWQKYIFAQLTSAWSAELIILMTIIGGFVAILEASGGIEAMTKKLSTVIGSRVKLQLMAWFGGICLFFSDSANCLILGPVFRSVADRLQVSREKLAYIVDSTASPVCMLVPITSWGVLIGGFIEAAMKENGLAIDAFSAYTSTLPYQFYTVLAVCMVPLVILSKKEFGPMIAFERAALQGNAKNETRDSLVNEIDKKQSYASVAIIPFTVLIIVMVVMFISFGFPNMTSAQFRISLASAYFLATLACIFMVVVKRIMNLTRAIESVIGGCKSMMPVLIMLVAAFGLGSICSEMNTAHCLADITLPFIPTTMLAAVIFVISVGISFATGSANGTQAIIIPLAIPLAIAAKAPLIIVISAAVTGGLFGDHCSPISDTSILSSMGCACDPVDHARTQLPYAMVAAGAAFITFIVAGFIHNPVILMPLSILLGIVGYGITVKFYGQNITETIKNSAEEV